MTLDDDLVGCFRLAIVELMHHACGRAPLTSRLGIGWRSKHDPTYLEVVEGRDTPAEWKNYSSCADLDHWKWFRLGVRAPWINRDEHLGFKRRVNVSRLAFAPQAVIPGREHRFEMGDTLIIWNRADTSDAHVCVLLEDLDPEPESGTAQVANYGSSGCSPRAWPACMITRPRMRWDVVEGRWELGDKLVQRTLSVADVLRAQPRLARPNLQGADLPGEVIDRLLTGA